jgi:hypothetical protein
MKLSGSLNQSVFLIANGLGVTIRCRVGLTSGGIRLSGAVAGILSGILVKGSAPTIVVVVATTVVIATAVIVATVVLALTIVLIVLVLAIVVVASVIAPVVATVVAAIVAAPIAAKLSGNAYRVGSQGNQQSLCDPHVD